MSETKNTKLRSLLYQKRRLQARYDPVVFCEHYLGIRLHPWQIEVMRSPSRKLAINCHRQAGKSTLSAILSLHMALQKSSSKTILISPSARQSRLLMEKIELYSSKLNIKFDIDNRMEKVFPNNSQIVALPGSEGTIRGFSEVDLLTIDEASRVEDDLFRAVRPMLALSRGRHLIMSTPFGKRGFFYETMSGKIPGWDTWTIPVTASHILSEEFLQEERAILGDAWYRQEWLCDFLDESSSLFSEALITGTISQDVEAMVF